MDAMPVGVFRMKNDGERSLTFLNTCMCQMLAYTEKEAKSLPAAEIFADIVALRALAEKALKNASAVSPEIEVYTKTKKKLLCSLSLVAVLSPEGGKTSYFDGILQDVSGVKRVEKDLKESKEIFQTVFNNSAVAPSTVDGNFYHGFSGRNSHRVGRLDFRPRPQNSAADHSILSDYSDL